MIWPSAAHVYYVIKCDYACDYAVYISYNRKNHTTGIQAYTYNRKSHSYLHNISRKVRSRNAHKNGRTKTAGALLRRPSYKPV